MPSRSSSPRTGSSPGGLAKEFRASASLMGGANQLEAVMARLQKREPESGDPGD
jgi:hypothetical protein